MGPIAAVEVDHGGGRELAVSLNGRKRGAVRRGEIQSPRNCRAGGLSQAQISGHVEAPVKVLLDVPPKTNVPAPRLGQTRATADRVADDAGKGGEIAGGVGVVVDLNGASSAGQIDAVLDFGLILGRGGIEDHGAGDSLVAVGAPGDRAAVAEEVDGHLAAAGSETAGIPNEEPLSGGSPHPEGIGERDGAVALEDAAVENQPAVDRQARPRSACKMPWFTVVYAEYPVGSP